MGLSKKNRHSNRASVSVVVVTRNRPNQLNDLLMSLHKSKFGNFELIIIDQSDQPIFDQINNKKRFNSLKYFFQDKKGLSVGRNLGVHKSTGDIICFTDDDCIVDKLWINNIVKAFDKKNVVGVFGQVLPYKPGIHKNKLCPCVINKNTETIIEKPTVHYKYIGFGNNMAFKREAFTKHGYFNDLLGVGSLGMSAEDAEYALRLLMKNEKLLSTNKVNIYHNRWLSHNDFEQQNKLYLCGEIACYAYLGIKGFIFGKEVVFSDIVSLTQSYKKSIKRLFAFKLISIKYFSKALSDSYHILRGLLVAVLLTIREY